MSHISVVSMIWEALLIGVIFIVVIAQMVTNKQIKKMKKLEKMFTEHEKSGLPVPNSANKKESTKVSSTTGNQDMKSKKKQD